MFYCCTSLTQAPELPANKLADYCYEKMFVACSNLEKAPELQATTLSPYCYNSMFVSCTSLEKAPELPATTLAEWCYAYMFSSCTNLNYIKVYFTDWCNDSTYNWVSNVASEGTFVCPNQLTEQYDESHIPVGWTVDKY
jgi:hypothetical protein